MPTELTGWIGPDRPRLAAVSSFGFSGTNAHVLLEEAPARPRERRPERLPGAADERSAPGPSPRIVQEPMPQVYAVPAGSADALPAAAARLADWLEGPAPVSR